MKEKMQEMDIEVEDFLKHRFEIVMPMRAFGIEATVLYTLRRGIENRGIGCGQLVVAFSNSYTSAGYQSRVGCLHSPPLTGWAPKVRFALEANHS